MLFFFQKWGNKEMPKLTLGEKNKEVIEKTSGLVERITDAAKEKFSEAVDSIKHSKDEKKESKKTKVTSPPKKKGSLDDDVPPRPPKDPKSFY